MALFQGDPGISYTVTPSDTVAISKQAKYLLTELAAGGMVTVKITQPNGSTDTFVVPAGQYLWCPATHVWATGLTVGAVIHAFY